MTRRFIPKRFFPVNVWCVLFFETKKMRRAEPRPRPLFAPIFGVHNLPAKVLIDRDGRVVARVTTSSELDQLVAKLLNAKH